MAGRSGADRSSSEPRTPAGRQTQEQRRLTAEQRLLTTAAALFARQGVERATLAQIGEEAGYSRGLVNHHFGSKAALIERLAHDVQVEFLRQLGDPDGDEIDVLVSLTRAYFGAVEEQLEPVRAFIVMWGAALPRDAVLGPVFAEFDAQSRGRIEALLRRGQRAGTISPTVEPVSTAALVMSTLRGMAAQFAISPDRFLVADLAATCERMLRNTLRPGGTDGDG